MTFNADHNGFFYEYGTVLQWWTFHRRPRRPERGIPRPNGLFPWKQIICILDIYLVVYLSIYICEYTTIGGMAAWVCVGTCAKSNYIFIILESLVTSVGKSRGNLILNDSWRIILFIILKYLFCICLLIHHYLWYLSSYLSVPS